MHSNCIARLITAVFDGLSLWWYMNVVLTSESCVLDRTLYLLTITLCIYTRGIHNYIFQSGRFSTWMMVVCWTLKVSCTPATSHACSSSTPWSIWSLGQKTALVRSQFKQWRLDFATDTDRMSLRRTQCTVTTVYSTTCIVKFRLYLWMFCQQLKCGTLTGVYNLYSSVTTAVWRHSAFIRMDRASCRLASTGRSVCGAWRLAMKSMCECRSLRQSGTFPMPACSFVLYLHCLRLCLTNSTDKMFA